MSVKKIISFKSLQAARALSTESADLIKETQSPNTVIDRRAFHHWQRPEEYFVVSGKSESRAQVCELMDQIVERASRIRVAQDLGNTSEIVTMSARIAVLSNELGLRRTAKLATQIGEAQMQGDKELADKLTDKLINIVRALSEDMKNTALK